MSKHYLGLFQSKCVRWKDLIASLNWSALRSWRNITGAVCFFPSISTKCWTLLTIGEYTVHTVNMNACFDLLLALLHHFLCVGHAGKRWIIRQQVLNTHSHRCHIHISSKMTFCHNVATHNRKRQCWKVTYLRWSNRPDNSPGLLCRQERTRLGCEVTLWWVRRWSVWVGRGFRGSCWRY